MNEEDLKDVAEDAKEQEISEYESLQDFVDLEDLSSLMGEDDFADLEDLGDISDLDLDGDGILEDEAASEDEPEDSAKESVSAEEPEGASEDALQDVVSGGEPEDALQDIVSGGEPEDAGSGEEQGNPLPDVVMPETDDGCQIEVVRKENVTIYEARIPLSEIYSPEVIANKPIQSNLSFSIRDYDGDRDKTFGYGGWFVLVDTKD